MKKVAKKSLRKKVPYYKRFFIALGAFLLAFFIFSPAANFNPSWHEPPRFVSKNGLLDVSLQAKTTEVVIGGKKVTSDVYNEIYPGPVFELKGGDTLKVHLDNQLTQSTNLHFHGSHVSPKGNSDNVLLNIKPGENFDYEYHLPSNHPPGLYWYHPHYHPDVENQVMGGMAGAIIVRGNIDNLPGIKGVPERLLLLSTQDGDDANSPKRLVNGQVMPALYLRPGEMQRWRIANISADDFYNFALPGQKLHIISRDGNTLSHVQAVDSEVMAPGDRIEILVQGGLWGTYDVQSLPFNEGFAHYTKDTFMHMVVAGMPMLSKELPKQLIPYDNFKESHIDNTRILTFSMSGTDDNPTFLLDGKQYNPDVIDQVMTLGTTEEWKLVNKSREVHPFHIHINPFQVISINGVPVDRPGLDDTFPIPARSTVIIRTKYKDFDGKYVLHCHILYHEDHGMMQVVEVVKPGFGQAPDNGMPDREGMMDMNDMDTMQMPESTRYNNKK